MCSQPWLKGSKESVPSNGDWSAPDPPPSQSKERAARRAEELAQRSDRPATGPGLQLGLLTPTIADDAVHYSSVRLDLDRQRRVATLTVRAPEGQAPATPDEMLAACGRGWPAAG